MQSFLEKMNKRLQVKFVDEKIFMSKKAFDAEKQHKRKKKP